MKNHKISIGQVWQRKSNKHEKICVISVSLSEKKVMVSGFPSMINPILSHDYLVEYFDIDDRFSY